jgi:RNA ligase
MIIYDLFEKELFAEMVEQGFVRVKPHPKAPLWIANYAEKTVYSKTWNDVTTQCRGLIFDDDHNIVARPWRKFWNLGEHSDIEGLLHGKVEVTDKMDGSLGILYWEGDDWAISTRGYFQSEQAIKGTEMLRSQYRGFVPNPIMTYLFEVIYPTNRIVLNYGEREELVLLGGVHINTGYSHGPNSPWLMDWQGSRTKVFAYTSLGTAMAASPRANAEGLVVRFLDTDLQVKIKQEDYCRAHAIVTGCSNRSIWEMLSKGEDLPEKASFMPDEFHSWMIKTAEDLEWAKTHWIQQALEAYGHVFNDLGFQQGIDRKEFAEKAVQSPFRAALFKLWDEQSIEELAWRAVRPVTIVRPFTRSEDAA